MVLLARKVIFNVVVWGLGLLTVFPLAWAVLSSFRASSGILGSPLRLWQLNAGLANYRVLFHQWPFGTWYENSMIVTVSLTILAVAFSALGGYGFAKFHFRGRTWLFNFLLLTLAIPFQAITIPLFLEIKEMHLYNNLAALIVPFMAPAIGVFLMRQHLLGFPDEVIDAGKVDGASQWTIFARLVVPSLGPPAAALGMLTFILTWTSFLWPLVALGSANHFTLALGLYNVFGYAGEGGSVHYGSMLAGGALIGIPPIIVFATFQRAYRSGLVLGVSPDRRTR